MTMSTTKASLNMSKTRTQRQQEPDDPQVAVIRNDPPFPTLCEAVTDEMMQGRNPKRPILTRLVYAAEVLSKDESLKSVLEGINTAASKHVNSNDPTGGVIASQEGGGEGGGNGSSSSSPAPTINVSGVCVELGSHVVCCLESEPTHIAQVMIEIQRRAMVPPPAPTSTASRAAVKPRGSSVAGSEHGTSAASATHNNNAAIAATSTGGGAAGAESSNASAGVLKNLRVLYLVDDIVSRTSQHWVHVEASRSKAAAATKKEEGGETKPIAHSSFARLDESIVKAVHNMLSIAAHTQGLNKGQRDHFATTGAVTSHGHLLPSVTLVESCIDSGLCLTLEEYISVFTSVPVITRDFDVNHPVEPPLVYE